MGSKYLDCLMVQPFRVQYRQNEEWGSTDYRIIAAGKNFHETLPDTGWKAFDGGSYFSVSTLPPSELFVRTDSVLSESERMEWRKVYNILSSLPRIIFREHEKYDYIMVKCGYNDIFFREIMKTHLGGRWDSDEKCWKIYPPDKDIRGAFLASLELFSRAKRRFVLGHPETISELPMELLEHQTYVHGLIRSAGAEGMRAFLVAHDMGLGKTYTSLSAVRSFMEHSSGRGCVAVVPPGTIRQWKKCASETGLSTAVYHSTNTKWDSLTDDDLNEANVIITGVEFLKESSDRLEKIVRQCSERMCVLDEATKCKNRDSANYHAMLPLSLASDFTLFLSGTPLLNTINEMENLILLGDPRYYPLKEFTERHVREKEQEIYIPSQKRRITIKKYTYVDEKGFRKRVLPFFDRETKKSASVGIILPDVEEKNIKVVPGTVEKRVCEILRSTYENFYLCSLDEEEALLELSSGRRSKSAAIMVYEQMVLNAPETILRSKSRGESEVLDLAIKEIEEKGIIPPGYVSEKTRILLDILDRPESKSSPAVVFTGFRTTAEMLRDKLSEAFQGRKIFLVAGGTSASKKAKVLEELKNTTDGIIICTDAMTYGVEMQFASTLIQYDLPWSPMVADQRTDRINRIGANGTRHVYYITATGTLEESKWKIHDKKRQTVDAVLQDGKKSIQQEFSFDI